MIESVMAVRLFLLLDGITPVLSCTEHGGGSELLPLCVSPSRRAFQPQRLNNTAGIKNDDFGPAVFADVKVFV
ncbi:hypothetical protein DY000_02040455 [Brassica cretica]|uniref:Secreted protein n=1 Tax=Brassica cretica TaxID=69181 RepID=A0ABQ7BDZ7_BRACR|nr:hypothetical protein DY000_02040455 [Brassica cretica]